MNRNCLTKELIYRADILDQNGHEKTYIGLTENSFKIRYANHMHSFRNAQKKNSTSLSKFVWHLKERGITPVIKWSIAAKGGKYKGGRGRCNLCSTEKLCILTLQANMLNMREETFSPCLHTRKFKIQAFNTALAAFTATTARI